jgi:hypothetical protein
MASRAGEIHRARTPGAKASWCAGMAERAAELIAEGADGSSLARFEACANEWLAGQGVADPPFRILSELGHKGVA